MDKHSRVYAKIDLRAVEKNFAAMREKMDPSAAMIAVIKTDGYGHGAAAIAHLVEKYEYLWGFAVATVEEALELRRENIQKPILILGFTFPEDYELIVENQLRPAVFQLSVAKQLSETAMRLGKTAYIHLAVDTGMSRIGFPDVPEAVRTIKEIAGLERLSIEGLFTHFARADEADREFTERQLGRYLNFVKMLENAGIAVPMKHCSNSAAIMAYPQAHLDAVRAGITIYGIYPSDEMDRRSMAITPVMELKSHIAYIKETGAGVPVSYGGTFVTEHPMRIATIPVGYGDGYPRSLSNRGDVLIHGQRARILGRVCMDQFMVDVTGIRAEELDEVTLLGKDGDDEITIDELGAKSGRFPYEFVCDIGKRVPRVYIEGDGLL